MTGLYPLQNPFSTKVIFVIIKKIEITNIRSYKEKTTIELPIGTILFQGDIGSGKSTILSAIEFALFGLGDVDANHLLRIGESKGSVLLEFENSGKSYIVFRSLVRRGNKIFQEEGFLYENGIKNSYSVGELKSRILNIIGINEKTQTKTTSTIYRFAIYTPQEMMKSVLSANNEKRVEILRRAFGIEEYSTAKKNAEKFSSWIRTLTRIKKSLINDLTMYRIDLQKIKDTSESLKVENEYFNDTIINLNNQIQIILKDILEMRKRKESMIQAESSITHLQSTIDKNIQLKAEINLELSRMNQELSGICQSEKIVADVTQQYQEYVQKREELVNVTEKARQYDKLLIQKVKLESNINSESEMLNSNIQKLDLELAELTSELDRCNAEIKNLDHLISEEGILKSIIDDSSKFQIEMDRISDILSNTKSEINSIKNEISKQKSELDTVLHLKQNAECPYCNQKLDQQHLQALENKFLQRSDYLKDKIIHMEKELEVTQSKKEEILIRIKEAESKKLELRKVELQIVKLNVVQNNIKQLDFKINEKISNRKSFQDKSKRKDWLLKFDKLKEITDQLNILSPYKNRYDILNNIVNHYQKINLESTYLEHSNVIKSKQHVIDKIRVKEQSLLEINTEITALSDKLAKAKSIHRDNEKVNIKLNELESQRVSYENELMNKKEHLAIRRADQENNLKQIESINKKICALEEQTDKIIFTDQVGGWLNQHFIPSLEHIESQVLISVKEEFNKLFQKWFYLLIEVSDIDAEIDEYFTPVVNQNGYRLEVESLSGGEKTSVALAYRLALNEIIRRIIMLDDNLLILDEPTDGFSKEQLVQIKYVLDELSAAQVIVVSHEKELEGYVETIFRVMKEREKSQVELVI
ncbi:MAG TPA: SMC family ATPase [Nitrososphaeraceae archaeon]|jgi:exonuclease SbcC